MMTDPTTDSRKRMLFLEKLQRLVIPAIVNQGNKTLDTDMGRTGGLTGGGPFFVYTEGAGDCLWIQFVDCFTKIESFVELVREGDRADLFALATARAL
jgi:hypothetical protein